MMPNPFPLAVNQSVLRMDVVGSSSGGAHRQGHLDRAFREVLDIALERVRFDRRYEQYLWFERIDGDSATLSFGASVPKAFVLGDFVLRELAVALGHVNRSVSDAYRLRVRVAVDDGEAVVNHPQINGEPVVTTSRIIEAAPFRAAVANALDQDFGVIVSDQFHHEVVRSGDRGLDRIDFRRVDVEVKDFRGPAWVHVPGGCHCAPPLHH
ncbi:hypothetical protein APASM_0594 [Actinosynnema pretiosum subsp. pretiosum]|nr:hypothetical protein APASM_0594 [Actinosynnema pretiosum subsp. pretiosum]